MPVALRANEGVEGSVGSSSCDRSRPLVFFWAAFALLPLGVARAVDSSAARRASFSAFLAASARRLASAASLLRH